jgi:hypothetical protein
MGSQMRLNEARDTIAVHGRTCARFAAPISLPESDTSQAQLSTQRPGRPRMAHPGAATLVPLSLGVGPRVWHAWAVCGAQTAVERRTGRCPWGAARITLTAV